MNPRTGIVRRLRTFRGEPGDAPVVVVGAELGDASRLGSTGGAAAAGGAGWNLDSAERAALGEAAERYCAGFMDHGRTWWGCAADRSGAVRGWVLFEPKQYERPEIHWKPWDENAALSWTTATDLSDGSTAWVPAQLVWMPGKTRDDERVLSPTATTGLAAAPTHDEAVLSGLYEIVERDAFTLTWLTKARPPEVDPATEPARITALRRFASFRLLDMTHDVGIPTYLCVLEQPSAVGTIVAVGAATRHDPLLAAEKAVLEAFQSVPYIRELVRAEPGWKAKPDFSNLRDFRDHCRFYTLHPEHRAGMTHLLDGPFDRVPMRTNNSTASASAAVRVRDVVGRLARCGLPAYVVDLTTSDVAAEGIHVVRVLVPGAQPLHGMYQAPHLASKRLKSAPSVLPFLASFDGEVNRWPHPFA